MAQIIIAMIIIALGIYVFWKYPLEKGNVMKLVVSAIFIILTLICKRFFTFMVPLFGVESLRVGIEYLPLLIAGFILSPSYAFIIGLCCDLVGLILVPTGFPFFGFTLTMILVCVIPSLVKIYSKVFNAKVIQMIVKGLVVVLGVGASAYIYNLDAVKISQSMHTITINEKLTLISICLSLTIIFLVMITLLQKKDGMDESQEFATWILAVTLVEVICTLCLTPLWLDIMYGVPFVVSLCIRVIKECFVLPIEIFIGYTVLKVVKRVFKRL